MTIPAAKITARKVSELLHTSGAPNGPWEPERLVEAAELIDSAADLPKILRDASAYTRKLQRAQKAVNELRLVLPAIIAFKSSQVFDPPISTNGLNRKLGSALALQKALVDFGVPPPNRLLDWRLAAAAVYLAYTKAAVSGSHSKNGPASRFVQLTLLEIGQGKRELSTIESALSSHWLTQKPRVTDLG